MRVARRGRRKVSLAFSDGGHTARTLSPADWEMRWFELEVRGVGMWQEGGVGKWQEGGVGKWQEGGVGKWQEGMKVA